MFPRVDWHKQQNRMFITVFKPDGPQLLAASSRRSGVRPLSPRSRTAATLRTAKTCLLSFTAGVWALIDAGLLLPPPLLAQQQAPTAPRQYLLELRRVTARKPFLTDSPDVYLEPKSLNQFFREGIYKKLQGNAYVGYDYDEGFRLQDSTVQLEVLKDLTPENTCKAAFRLALEQALSAAGLEIKAASPHQLGVCIVGMEPRETPSTLAGIMVEAYVRNSVRKKSFFIRYGAGHPRSLAAAIHVAAEMLVSQIVSRRWTAEQSLRSLSSLKSE